MNSGERTEFDTDVTFVDVPSGSGGADPLTLFESESEPNQPGVRTAPGTMDALKPASLTRVRGPITLDQVLGRLGSVTWMEAVAIVEGLCGVLTQGGRARVPEMSGIAITESGGVAVDTGGSKDAAGPLLARILHSLAATGSVPAPLRLFITKWASASEKHSIAEFATDLKYFSRPDGQSLIQAVYERAASTVPVQPVQPKLRSKTPRQVPPPRRQAQDPRRLFAAAAAVIMLGVALTAFFALRGLGSSGGSSPAQPVDAGAGTDPESAAATATASQGTRNQTGPVAAGSRALGAATPSGAPARSVPSAALPAPPQVRGGGAPAPVSSAVRATLGSPSPSAASARSAAPLSTPGGASPNNMLGLGPSRAGTRDVSGAPIYSRSDLDVIPPSFRQPQLPAQLLSGLQPDMNTIELIVSPAGFVERVRLLSTPKRMADMMLLSGAKNWEFEPALKDGQSVRYRLELSWAATP